MKKRLRSFGIIIIVLLIVILPACRRKRVRERIATAPSEIKEEVSQLNSDFSKKAEQYLKEGNLSNLQSLIQQKLKISPNNSLALTYQGIIFFKKGDLLRARNYLEIALKSNPYNQLAKSYLSDVYLLLAKKAPLNKKVSYLEKVLTYGSKKENIRVELARQYKILAQSFSDKDWKTAKKYWKTALKLSPSDYTLYLDFVKLLLEKEGQAKMNLFLEETKKLNPKNPVPDLIYAEIRGGGKENLSQNVIFEKLKEKTKKLEFSQIKADDYFALGLNYMKGKLWAKAIKAFSQALTVNPEKKNEIYFYLAKAYYSLDDFSRARFYLDEVSAIQSLDAKLLDVSLLLKEGKLKEAEQKLAKLRVLYPNNKEIFYKELEVKLKRKRFNEVISSLENVLRENSSDQRALELIGMAWAKKGNFDRALSYWDRLLLYYPNSAKIYYNKGVICVRKKDFVNAIINFSLAKKFQPENPLYYYSLGLAFRQNGLLGESNQVWKQLIEKFPNSRFTKKVRNILRTDNTAISFISGRGKSDFNDANKLYQQAYIYLKIGNYRESEKLLRKILSLNPENLDSIVTLCQIEGKLGKYYREVALGLEALELDKKKKNVYKYLGEGYLMLGLVTEAINWLEKAYEYNPNDWEVIFYLALYNLIGGDDQKAQEYMDTLSQLYKGTIILQKANQRIGELVSQVKIPQTSQEEILIRKRLVRQFRELELYQEILKEINLIESKYKEYLEREVQNLSGETLEYQVEYFDKDLAFYKMEALYNLEYYSAITDIFQKLPQLFKGDLELQFYLAEAFYFQDAEEKARELYQELLGKVSQNSPLYGMIMLGLGRIAEKEGKLEEAISDYKISLKVLNEDKKLETMEKIEKLKAQLKGNKLENDKKSEMGKSN